ncbi:hypothetical protein [Demequina subtropica]|uniref:hypothetical protein n=1 Tax=Demequina subtropica TaxID=1638989 RepID=UPI000784B11A|nr:hypothetical protein [Demequina subtropica]
MTRHTVDTADLHTLKRTLDDLTDFLTAFERSATNHGSALLASWSGQASREFIDEVGVWAVGALALRDRTDALAAWVHAARQAYEAAIDQAKEVAG